MSKNLIISVIILIIVITVFSVYFFVYNVNNTPIIPKSNKGEVSVYVPPVRTGNVGVTVLPINQSEKER